MKAGRRSAPTQEHERDTLKRKLDAGARFVITQPVVGTDAVVQELHREGVPVFVGAWMSRRSDPLCACVGIKKPETSRYGPVENLLRIHEGYPGFGIYLAQLGFKSDCTPLLTRCSPAAQSAHAGRHSPSPS